MDGLEIAAEIEDKINPILMELLDKAKEEGTDFGETVAGLQTGLSCIMAKIYLMATCATSDPARKELFLLGVRLGVGSFIDKIGQETREALGDRLKKPADIALEELRKALEEHGRQGF